MLCFAFSMLISGLVVTECFALHSLYRCHLFLLSASFPILQVHTALQAADISQTALIYSVLIWLLVLIAFISNNILFHFCSISFFGPLCFLLYLYLFLGIYTSLFPVMCPTTLFSLDHNQFFLVFPFPAVPTSFPDLFCTS